MKAPEELAKIYERVPAGIDILVSHQAPYGYGDLGLDFRYGRSNHIGSHELLATIDRSDRRW